ncbi:MAG: hypothetical protein A2W22_04755 [Candidatus Levybacteria bacterium RBG_16_35_11]|nr:MAG: hypothetical protein A2W22_04755 [Candidatus Levybacteria bacterium RBG_16_35_11]
MNDELRKIIGSSTFVVHEDRYIYAKAKSVPQFNDYLMISKDQDEITVVMKEKNLSKLDLIEKNKDFYKAIELKVSVPFYSVGFLAAVTEAISKEGMDILIISTYSKDYILVREEHLEKAQQTLLNLGFKNYYD